MACKIFFKKFILTMLFFIFASAAGRSFAQDDMSGQVTGTPNFYAEIFTYSSDQPGKGHIELYVKIPYSEINFFKDGEQYIGRLEIAAAILSHDKQQVWQKSQSIELNLKEFARTISNQLSSLRQFSTDLIPGEYNLDLMVSDPSSKKSARLERAFTVRDVKTDSIALSDLMFVNQVSIEGERKNIVPNLTNSFENRSEKIFLFFEVYNNAQLDSVQLTCKMMNIKDQPVAVRKKDEKLTGDRKQIIWQLDTLSVSAGRYTFIIEASGKSRSIAGPSFHASVRRNGIFRIEHFPLTITDIDKAVDQLIYVAKGDEMDHIKSAESPEEKADRFIQFWAKRDPDPKTVKNELMEEYYARVNYANKNFVSYLEGWRTDRGMVLIKYGMPENIDRHPFDANSKPYEIWYYYDQNRRFIFIDETGFSDYRLQYPETDLWGRMR